MEGIFSFLARTLRIFVLVVCSLCYWLVAGLRLLLLVKSETMANTPMDTNRETPLLGTPCTLLLRGNIGVPLMTTLNLLGFTLGISVWFFSTPNVLNDYDASQANTLYQGHQNIASSSSIYSCPPLSMSCGEISDTSNM